MIWKAQLLAIRKLGSMYPGESTLNWNARAGRGSSPGSNFSQSLGDFRCQNSTSFVHLLGHFPETTMLAAGLPWHILVPRSLPHCNTKRYLRETPCTEYLLQRFRVLWCGRSLIQWRKLALAPNGSHHLFLKPPSLALHCPSPYWDRTTQVTKLSLRRWKGKISMNIYESPVCDRQWMRHFLMCHSPFIDEETNLEDMWLVQPWEVEM